MHVDFIYLSYKNADKITGTTIAKTRMIMITLENIFFVFLLEKLNILHSPYYYNHLILITLLKGLTI